MRRRLVLRSREAANRRAGTSRHAREVRGRKTQNPGYRPGDNWATCQRCGFTVYASDLVEDGYKEGLMVCPKCYDPPHPQDYIRVRPEDTSPLEGSTGDLDSYSSTAAAGSTSLPASGAFSLDITAGTGSIADQEDNAGDTISTLTTSTSFPSAIHDPLVGVLTVSSYSAVNLPDGLSINSSSGAITGTIDSDAYDESPNTVAVTQTWSNDYKITLTFTWTVNNAGLSPDLISGLLLWWDFSDSSKVWLDEARTSAITNGGLIRGVTDKSGNSNHGTVESAGNAPTWNNPTKSGVAGGDFTKLAGNPTIVDTGTALSSSLSPVTGFTAITVAQIPTVDATDARTLMSHTGIDGTQYEIAADEAGGVSRLYTIVDSGVGPITDGTAEVSAQTTDWFVFQMYVQDDEGEMSYNSDETDTPAHAAHDAGVEAQVTYRVGGGTDTGAGIRTGWNTNIGETMVWTRELTAFEKAALYIYLQNKWSLTDTLA